MVVNFNWMGFCICELKIKLQGEIPTRCQEEQHFIHKLLSLIKNKQGWFIYNMVIERITELVLAGKVHFDVPIPTDEDHLHTYEHSL
jgi:hypothetical protein